MAKRGVKLGSKRGHYKPRVTDDFEKYDRAREIAKAKGFDLESKMSRVQFESELQLQREFYPDKTKQQLINNIVDSEKPFSYQEARRISKAIREKGGIGEIYEADNGVQIKVNSYKDVIGMDRDQRKVFFSILVNDLGYTYREADAIYEG